MKISGFTFLRNATLLGYPYVESIKSLLPLVDEYVVNIGESEDDTYEKVVGIGDPKIRIIRSHWNEKMQSNGFVYAQQKMIAQYNCTGDWAFYLEGDEVLHEQDIEKIRAAMLQHVGNPKVEALAFRYRHFYGTPDYTAISPPWYRNEARVIRNTIRTYAPDGLFWLVMPSHRKGRYPFAAHTDATIYHYGWVRSSQKHMEKIRRIDKYWDYQLPKSFDYGNIDPKAVKVYDGSHPLVMQRWLKEEAETQFRLNPDYQLTKRNRKHRVSMMLEKWFNIDLSKRHYKLLK